MNTDQPLIAQIEEGQLVISIGIANLAYCSEHDSESPFYGRKITDAEQLCKDICEAMNAKDNLGHTPLWEFLDNMQQAAIDNGSIAIEEESSGEAT